MDECKVLFEISIDLVDHSVDYKDVLGIEPLVPFVLVSLVFVRISNHHFSYWLCFPVRLCAVDLAFRIIIFKNLWVGLIMEN